MNKEEQRLLSMLEENKISDTDYQMLIKALNKKSFCTLIESSVLINPFQKIAGFKALLMGLVLMIIMSLVGVYANVFYDGSFGYVIPVGIKTHVKPNFLLLLYQNMAAVVLVSTLFLASALFFRQKGIRVIDFFGTVALARYPIFICLLSTMVHQLLKPELFTQDFSQGYELHFDLINTLSTLLFLACFIWQIVTYFFALKESSGFEDKRLWSCFIVCMLAAESLAMICTRFPLFV